MLELIQFLQAIPFSVQFSTILYLLPYFKIVADVFMVTLQIWSMLFHVSFLWISGIVYQSSMTDMLIFILSIGITTKFLIDAADLEFSVRWRQIIDISIYV